MYLPFYWNKDFVPYFGISVFQTGARVLGHGSLVWKVIKPGTKVLPTGFPTPLTRNWKSKLYVAGLGLTAPLAPCNHVIGYVRISNDLLESELTSHIFIWIEAFEIEVGKDEGLVCDSK